MFTISKEELEKLYVKDNKTSREIAKMYGVSNSTVLLRLHKYGIPTKPAGNYADKEYKFATYFDKNPDADELLKSSYYSYKSIKDIAKSMGVGERMISNRIKELGLTRDVRKMMSREQYNSDKDSEIVRLYNEGLSSVEVGKIVGMSHQIVLNHLEHCGIKRRTLSESQFSHNRKEIPEQLNDYDSLYELYVINRMTKKELSDMLCVSTRVIDRALKNFGIRVRGYSEAKKGLFTGNKAGHWIDGRSPLYVRLRTYFRTWQSKERIKMDGNKCQLCGSKKSLHVHHIIPFKSVFNEILNEHKDLDPVADADKLYEIMFKDSRMNDMSNLITYCSECHLFKIHNYKKKSND